MKNLKKLLGLMVTSGLAFGFAGTVNAAVSETSNVCTVASEEDIAEALTYGSTNEHNQRCNVLEVNSSFEVKGTHDLGDRSLSLKNNAKLTVSGSLSFENTATAKPTEYNSALRNYAIYLNDGTELIVTGKVSITGNTPVGNGSSTTTSNPGAIKGFSLNKGTITIEGAKAELYISGTEVGVDNISAFNVKDNGTFTAEKINGYAISCNNGITVDNGNMISKDNLGGITGKLVTTGDSTITATGAYFSGFSLKDGSNIGGNTVLTATGNNSGKNEGDITIANSATVTVSGNAQVIAGKVRSTTTGNGTLVVNGEGAAVTVDEKQSNLTITPTLGVVNEGGAMTVKFTSDDKAEKIVLDETTTIKNDNSFAIKVYTADSKTPVTVKANSTEKVEVVKVTIDKVVYNLFKGQKITDLVAYEDLVKTAGFKSFLKANGHEFDIDDEIYNDTILTISTTPQSSAPADIQKPADNKKPAADNTASKNPQTYDAGIMGSLVLVLSSIGTLGYASKKVLSK